MNTEVLVTGANGQLAKTLHKLYHKNEEGIKFTFVTKEDLDITNSQEVNTYFNNNSFQYCINCAAYTNVEQAEKTPDLAYKVNAEAVKTLAEACKKTNTILIHISTDYVFDGEKDTPYTESDAPNPINEYGKSKLLGEQYIQQILERYFIIRTSWLYSEYGNNFLKTVYKNLAKNNKIHITTSQMGSPTSCKSLAYFICFFMHNKTKYGTYHFSDGSNVTWFEFAKKIESNLLTNTQGLIIASSNYKTAAKRPKFSVLDNTKRLQIYNRDIPMGNSIKDLVSLL